MHRTSIQSHSGRFRHLANILARHGLGYLVGQFGVEDMIPFHRGWFGHSKRNTPYTQPEHLRMALEEMGTVWVKLGQVLSTRADLLPPEYLNEFARLQDQAPTVSSEIIEDVIVESLNNPMAVLFASFDPEPLAAASIGQVHAATLDDGTPVVVKVRRPGVVEQVEEDLEILQKLALAASRRWAVAQQYDVIGVVQEFAESLRRELDYVREGRNAERFAANFSGVDHIHIPRVYWDFSSGQVLTLERVHGLKIGDLAGLDAAGLDRRGLAQRAAHMVMQMIFEDGVYHADPHPGNFFIEPGGQIALMDFGMVGELDARTKDHLVNLVVAVAGQDPDRMVDAVLEIAIVKGRVDRLRLRQDLQRLVTRYLDRPIIDIDAGAVIQDIMTVVREHHLQLPSNLALVLKMGIMVEGLGQQLDPDFRLVAVIEPYGERFMLRRYSPTFLARRLGMAGMDAAQLSVEIPGQLRRILGDLGRGTFEIGTRPSGLEPTLDRLERLANRIVVSIIAAAFIVGWAILMAGYHPFGEGPAMEGISIVGFLIAGVLGTYLIWDILRKRSR